MFFDVSEAVIIWIVKEAREEHRSAIEWLNINIDKEISFFLLEIHAYKIGDSLVAPKFEIIEQPNDFIKSSKINRDGDLSKTESDRIAFWNDFNGVLIDRGRPFNVRKASTDHWYDVAIGTSDAHLSLTLVNKANSLGVELYIGDNKDLFDELYLNKNEIEEKLGFKLDWQRLDSRKASRIVHYIPGLDFEKQDNYPHLMHEGVNKILIMREVFRTYL